MTAGFTCPSLSGSGRAVSFIYGEPILEKYPFDLPARIIFKIIANIHDLGKALEFDQEDKPGRWPPMTRLDQRGRKRQKGAGRAGARKLYYFYLWASLMAASKNKGDYSWPSV
ncbi:MAG: hypothetical protein GX819_06550 [Clostridiaceae bacterium]|nr:hypothetical protein [Clostridiaceae bacterium]